MVLQLRPYKLCKMGVRDMVNLNKAHPQTANEFSNGKFTICETKWVFSSMAINQATVKKGFRKILLHTVDTDVVSLAVKAAAKLDIQELWVAFGTAKKFRYILVHEISLSLCPDKSQALPMFHAYTG